MTREEAVKVILDGDTEAVDNETAMEYIAECARSVGIEVIEGKTAFDILFMAEIMRRLRALPSIQPKFIAKSDGTIEQIKNCDDCISKKEVLDAIYSSIPSELTPDGRRVVEISTLIDHIAEM